ncbi:MAG: periplasmic heavy metal sensor, partial [Pseudomonadota bacterium]
MTTGSDRILGMTTTGARRVLVASLVLNFLILGGLFGLGLRGDPTPRPDGGAFGHITDLVAEDRREAVRAVMKERSKLRRAARRERTENWRDIADQIGAENFDADALGA